jgi:hypothetical protein
MTFSLWMETLPETTFFSMAQISTRVFALIPLSADFCWLK